MAQSLHGVTVEDREPILFDEEVSELRVKAQVSTLLPRSGEGSGVLNQIGSVRDLHDLSNVSGDPGEREDIWSRRVG